MVAQALSETHHLPNNQTIVLGRVILSLPADADFASLLETFHFAFLQARFHYDR